MYPRKSREKTKTMRKRVDHLCQEGRNAEKEEEKRLEKKKRQCGDEDDLHRFLYKVIDDQMNYREDLDFSDREREETNSHQSEKVYLKVDKKDSPDISRKERKKISLF